MLMTIALGVYINMGAGINGAGTTYMGEKRAWLEEMGFAGVRQDIHWDPDVWTRAIEEFRGSRLTPIFVIHGATREQLVQEAYKVALAARVYSIKGYLEVTNEPNYRDDDWKWNPRGLAEAINEISLIPEVYCCYARESIK